MDIDSAANFLVGSILIGVGLLTLCACLLVVNNLFSRWWKPVNFGYWAPQWIEPLSGPGARFVDSHPTEAQPVKTEPSLNPNTKDTK